MNRNVLVLAVSQALMMSGATMMAFVGGLVGSDLAPDDRWSTFPVTSSIIGSAVFAIPVAMSMKKFGRRKAFVGIAVLSIIISLMASYSIDNQSFILFCFCAMLLGIASATVQQFRFAAMESVSLADAPKAASYVLLGGILAAFIGPEIALFGINLTDSSYSGSFLLLSALFLVGSMMLFFYINPELSNKQESVPSRSLREISRNPDFWVAIISAMIGYSVMSFIMTGTPVSMHIIDHHNLADTKFVIQSHIIAMFLPSFITPIIIRKYGIRTLLYAGVVSYAICIVAAMTGHSIINYWIALVTLGVGWNFLFLGGTNILPRVYRDNERFKVQATNDFTVLGSQSVASISAGWFVFSSGWEFMLSLVIPFILIQLMMIIFWKDKSNSE